MKQVISTYVYEGKATLLFYDDSTDSVTEAEYLIQ
jgi:hypothetical protein